MPYSTIARDRPTKSCSTQRDLAMAYTPGVAEPCREIELNPDRVFDFTAKGNLVAVITNGTAVLGLGHIGPLAGKPVMEGKSVLFKRFADIDVFDIELSSTNSDEIIRVIKVLEPTFGGINLEDIRAPECFYIEERLKEIFGVGDKVSETVLTFLSNSRNQAWLDDLARQWQGPDPSNDGKPVSKPFLGKLFVITGEATVPRRQLEELVKKLGGRVTSSVSPKTAYLVIGSLEKPDYVSTKKTKALQLNLPIINEHQLMELAN